MFEIEAFGKKYQFEGDLVMKKEVKLSSGGTAENYVLDTYFKDRPPEECKEIVDNCSRIAQRAYNLIR